MASSVGIKPYRWLQNQTQRASVLWVFLLCVPTLLVGCQPNPKPASLVRSSDDFKTISADVYFDKVYGAWQATLVANHTGLVHEGEYLTEPSSADAIDLVLLEEWPTDDDTSVEWVDLHILETHGLNPTYLQIRDEWVDHLNHDIWVSALKARQLMDEGYVPPETSRPDLNPEGVWSIGAQLQTEVFGMMSPGLPETASQRAVYFAKVTNSGLAVDASAFYTQMYAMAYFEEDIPTLIEKAQLSFPEGALINRVVNNVRTWHEQNPDDWRATRQHIQETYDTDPHWWASKVNFASTIMALLYGEGDMLKTLTIAALAGWDADNNMTTVAGLLGIISGYQNLPDDIRTSSNVYFNEDVTGDLPKRQAVDEIARRTQRLAEAVIIEAGGEVRDGVYYIPISDD